MGITKLYCIKDGFIHITEQQFCCKGKEYEVLRYDEKTEQLAYLNEYQCYHTMTKDFWTEYFSLERPSLNHRI